MSWKGWTAIVVVALIVIGAVSGGSSDKKSKSNGDSQSTPTPVTRQVSTTDRPLARLTLRQRLDKAVTDINLDGDGGERVKLTKVGGRYDVRVYHNLADNITGGLVQRGAELDATKIFQTIFDGPDQDRVGDVTVVAMGKLIDKLGNESTGATFTVTLPGVVGHKVNWANIDQVDLRDVWLVDLDRIN